MYFTRTKVFNFENAIHGMRNPMNSWDKSDSHYDNDRGFLLGENDLKLAQKLIKAGSEHRKFMRQIMVSVDVTAPIFWWNEYDTYKVGTVANSTSKMHKLASTPITEDCFERDDFRGDLVVYTKEPYDVDETVASYWRDSLIPFIETLRQKFNETGDIAYWKELIRALPESWLQTRTLTMSYENLLAMCSKGQRRFHKLTEWSISFIQWARRLPYAQDLLFLDEFEDKND